MEAEKDVEKMFEAWLERTKGAKNWWKRTEELYAQGRALEIDVERCVGVYLQCRSVTDMLSWVLQREVEIP